MSIDMMTAAGKANPKSFTRKVFKKKEGVKCRQNIRLHGRYKHRHSELMCMMFTMAPPEMNTEEIVNRNDR